MLAPFGGAPGAHHHHWATSGILGVDKKRGSSSTGQLGRQASQKRLAIGKILGPPFSPGCYPRTWWRICLGTLSSCYAGGRTFLERNNRVDRAFRSGVYAKNSIKQSLLYQQWITGCPLSGSRARRRRNCFPLTCVSGEENPAGSRSARALEPGDGNYRLCCVLDTLQIVAIAFPRLHGWPRSRMRVSLRARLQW